MRILILWLISLSFLPAQDGSGDPPLIQRIAQSYARLQYEETDRLLGLALDAERSFSAADRVEIFKYAAFRRFQAGETDSARHYFWRLLEIDPAYSLDPVATSPKILGLFQQTKIDYLLSLQDRLTRLEESVFRRSVPWRSLVLPGWEQWHRGYRWKGAVWAGLAVAAGTGTIAAVLESERRYDDYLAERNPDRVLARYDDYNRAYRGQFFWGYALAGVWLASHLDALFFCPERPAARLSVAPLRAVPGVAVRISF